jgi:hypothetical protein
MTVTELKKECAKMIKMNKSDALKYMETVVIPEGILKYYLGQFPHIIKCEEDHIIKLINYLGESYKFSKEVNLNDIEWLADEGFFRYANIDVGLYYECVFPYVRAHRFNNNLYIVIGGHDVDYDHGANIYETSDGIYIDIIGTRKRRGIFLEVPRRGLTNREIHDILWWSNHMTCSQVNGKIYSGKTNLTNYTIEELEAWYSKEHGGELYY